VKIAWLTPFSQRSEIGHYSAEIVAALSSYANVTVFASDLHEGQEEEACLPDASIVSIPSSHYAELLKQLMQFDIRVYNIGNYPLFHHSIYQLALVNPGITVLHDLVMHHFFAFHYLNAREDPAGYLNELNFCHGADGEAFGQAILDGEPVDMLRDPRLLTFNMAKSAIRCSEGNIVHAEFARDVVATIAEAPTVHIPLPSPHSERSLLPRSWPRSSADEPVRLLSIGTINPNTLVAEVVKAIAMSPYLRGRVVYDVVGASENTAYAREIECAIDAGGLRNSVFLVGHLQADDLESYLARADLVINLRNPHFGESAYSLVEASFTGKPSLVWNHGHYDEFPDNAVMKISSLEELSSKLETLCQDSQLRAALGVRAQVFAQATFSTARYCDRFFRFARQSLYNRPVLQLTDIVADVLAELGQAPASPATVRVLAELAVFADDHVVEHSNHVVRTNRRRRRTRRRANVRA
jgi:glycosyltransferase involved in cell wall biosynthesis